MWANLLNNSIGAEQAQNLATILKEHATLKSLCGNKGDETVLDMSGKQMGADGAIMLAPEIVANGALEKLLMGDNRINGAEAGKALSDALSANMMLKELDLSSQGDQYDRGRLEAACAKELAIGLSANGALETITFGDVHTATMKTDMTKADISGKQLGASGAIIVAAFLPKCQ